MRQLADSEAALYYHALTGFWAAYDWQGALIIRSAIRAIVVSVCESMGKTVIEVDHDGQNNE